MSLNGGRGSTVAGLDADWSRPEISKQGMMGQSREDTINVLDWGEG